MSEKDNFGTGFLLGTIIGGVVGGIVGTVIANKNNNSKNNWDDSGYKNSNYSSFDEDKIENSRINLEEKINQLNHAIDEVRVTLTKNSQSEFIDN